MVSLRACRCKTLHFRDIISLQKLFSQSKTNKVTHLELSTPILKIYLIYSLNNLEKMENYPTMALTPRPRQPQLCGYSVPFTTHGILSILISRSLLIQGAGSWSNQLSFYICNYTHCSLHCCRRDFVLLLEKDKSLILQLFDMLNLIINFFLLIQNQA